MCPHTSGGTATLPPTAPSPLPAQPQDWLNRLPAEGPWWYHARPARGQYLLGIGHAFTQALGLLAVGLEYVHRGQLAQAQQAWRASVLAAFQKRAAFDLGGYRISFNPQRFGTGLSIKSVDALRHGRPLVAPGFGAWCGGNSMKDSSAK